jgi:hypothetical protein
MNIVTHIGTKNGNNLSISPRQLLELALEDIKSGEINPIRMLIQMVEVDGADDSVFTYRANLPVDKEQCLLANQLFKLQWRRTIE